MVAAEKTQIGNPHRLPFWQHVFPARSISRFAGLDGNVAVKHRQSKREFRLSPKDRLFCAQRSWDQRTEDFAKEIEDEFQALADEVIAGRRLMNPPTSRIVTRFFALWRVRFHFRHNPMPDHPIYGIVGEKLSKDQEEILERNGVSFFRMNQTMPGRFVTGIQSQTNILRVETALRNAIWGVASSINGEFVVPDTFGNLTFVPLTPKLLLRCNRKDNELSDVEVAKVNQLALQSARDYYIARDFAMCQTSVS